MKNNPLKNRKVIRKDTSFTGLEKSGLPPDVNIKTINTIGIINNNDFRIFPVVE